MSRINYKVVTDCKIYQLKHINDYQQKLVKNFLKCCEWVKDNAEGETIDGIRMPHQVYYKIEVEVEDGELYVSYGSHGAGFEIRMSRFGSDVMVQGSEQHTPYRYENVHCGREDRIEEFLQNWTNVKQQILNTIDMRKRLSSDDFVA